MRLFRINEAKHYCSSFNATQGDAENSINTFQRNRLGRQSRSFREGNILFEEYRDCSLRDVERSLFFAASYYRRCLDLMLSSAAPWAHVTIYYGSWYASRGLLGMFGCTIFNEVVVDVNRGSPGQQELRLRVIGNRQGQQSSTYHGSHRRYWDFFYTAVTPLRPMVQPNIAPALYPVSNNPVWLIQQRNTINYDSWEGLQLSRGFQKTFSNNSFPGSLPGPLLPQFKVLESLLELSFVYASQFGLHTDAFVNLGVSGNLRAKVSELIYNEKAPGLVRKTKKSTIT